ncbi:MAG: glycosyltransferase [Faecalibacterium sp.]
MKILIASDCYKPIINGLVTSIDNLKSGLEARGHEVRVLTLSNTRRSYKEGDAYYIGSRDLGRVYPGVIRFQACNSRKEMKEIIAWHPDIIHTQSEFCTFFIAKRIAKRLSIPMVHTYHTIYEDYTHYFSASRRVGKKVVIKATRYVSRSVNCIIAPTQKINNILTRYHVACPVQNIPTGITLDKFAAAAQPGEIAALKDSLGVPQEHFVMLSVSRIGKEKNINELIEYMNTLKDKPVSMILVGDGPARENLQKQIDKAGLHDVVKFTGMVKPQDVPTFYKMADLFISASTSEAQGLTYIEALATGTPLLCRKDDCLEGVLHEGENGFYFTNQDEFLQHLSYFMGADYAKETMAQSTKATAEYFTKDNFVNTVERLYQSFVN